MQAAAILVVHDHRGVLQTFEEALAGAGAFTAAADEAAALPFLEDQPCDVVVADLDAPGGAALRLLERARRLSSPPEVILLTGRRGLDQARLTLDAGAFAFMVKPFRAADAARVVARAVEHRRLRAEVARLRSELQEVFAVEQLVGTSPPMRAAAARIAAAAAADGDVCLRGEPGTGKDLAARVIHFRSARRGQPFVAVHCAGLDPASTAEHLFGGGDGAAGVLARAEGGTLFLDEVSALPAAAQERLGRLLLARRGAAARLGAAGFRVVAASRLDLAAEARAGRFRRELARLLRANVIALPPLRERAEDIPQLAGHFLERCARRATLPIRGFDAAALRALAAWRWPGNCRELELAVERAVAGCQGPFIQVQDLPAEILEERSPPGHVLASLPYREAMDHVAQRAAREYLGALLEACHGNVSAAARRARVQRETFHRLLARHGLRSEDYRRPRDA